MAAKNALKGFVYQHLVNTLLTVKMDLDENIELIETEKEVPHNFDDSYIKTTYGIYFFQIKNYQGINIDDIKIYDGYVKLKNTKIKCSSGKNILIINSEDNRVNNRIFGFDSFLKENVHIIALSPKKIYEILDTIIDENRLNTIIKYCDIKICSEIFSISRNDLPPIRRFNIDLNEETIVKRRIISKITPGILHVIGKPGVGKSHYFNELREQFEFDIEYRFWINSTDNVQKRLIFKEFLKDVGKKVFGSCKKFTRDELVSEITKKDLSVIIDGLDHVERYSKKELKKYISFINDISKVKVVILSRPLETTVNWKPVFIPYWNKKELTIFLENKYSYKNQLLIEDILKKTSGYPIICAYLAEHFNIYNKLPHVSKIDTVKEYYTQLFEIDYGDDINYDELSIFLLNNYYITVQEIEDYLGPNSVYVTNMIKRYPYLFNIEFNRITLIHDSLNTFLKEKNMDYPKYCNHFIPKIEKSILNKEITYLSRFNGFEFDDEFVIKTIKLYSNFDVLKELLDNNIDFESIKEFYVQLKESFGDYENEFDIYQYYSFLLISLIFDRVDLEGYEDLIFHTIKYMENKHINETIIYSQGVFWQSYTYYKKEHWKENRLLYPSRMLYDIENIFNKENNYYVFKEHGFDENKAITYLKNLNNNYQKEELVIDFFINSKIHNPESQYSKIVDDYLNNGFNYIKEELFDFYKKINLIETPHHSYWSIVPYIIKTTDEKILNNYTSLKELIEEKSKKGSFETHDYVSSFIRLKNYQSDLHDISEINKFYTMYFNNKDTTVINIDTALLIFEKHDLIKELDSYNLLINLRKQSEKGIYHLPFDYISKKNPNFIKTITSTRKINEDLWIFDLSPEYIDKLSQDDIVDAFDKLFYRHNQFIDYENIKNIFKSKYSSAFIDQINVFGFVLYNVPQGIGLEHKIYKIKFKYENDEEYNSNHIPLEDNKIAYEDKEFIIKNDISCLELSSYVDGYFYAMPYNDFYDHYNKEELNENLLKIIHTAMYIKFSFYPEGFVGWAMLLGNVPYLLDLCNYDVKWERIYQIFKNFLELSLINI